MKRLGIVAAAAWVLTASMAIGQPAAPAKPGWITTTNKPCKVWNPEPQPNESVTWSGGCKNGLASGKGVLKWTENGQPDMEFDGEYENGKRNGPGVIIAPDGTRAPGVWSNDEPVVGDKNSI